MRSLAAFFRRDPSRPYVRPWALATPIAVLLFCLPLLRPLHHPGQASVDEDLRLATISAIVEHKAGVDASLAARLAIDTSSFPLHSHLIRVNGGLYSDQPPMLAVLLSVPYWVLHRWGYRLQDYSVLVPYILTMLGVTLPAAAAGGLIYRMGRLFELQRPWRAGLAATSVFATGLASYAVVLNPHVPAAVLVLAAAGCLVHLASSKVPSRGGGWLVLAGFCAALAATIDLAAVAFLVLLLIVIVTMRLRPTLRVGGVILYALGAAPPLLLHATLTTPLTGGILPGLFYPDLSATRAGVFIDDSGEAVDAGPDSEPAAPTDLGVEQDDAAPPGIFQSVERGLVLVLWALVGEHGLLVHFPIVLLGFAGMFAVMHRNWPTTTKVLAADSALAMIGALIVFALVWHGTLGGADAAFANRRLIVFMPILLLWAGAWLRRQHAPSEWTAAGFLLAFSVIVTLLGATNPMPPGGYTRYTAFSALRNLVHPSASATAIADR